MEVVFFIFGMASIIGVIIAFIIMKAILREWIDNLIEKHPTINRLWDRTKNDSP